MRGIEDEMITQNTLNLLIAARWLISDPDSWTKGAYAKTAKDRTVGCREDAACKWDIIGSVMHNRCGMILEEKLALYALKKAIAVNRFVDLRDFNDTANHSKVLALFEKAIATLSAEIDA